MSGLSQKVIEPGPINEQWTRQYEPFRIVGNVYWVGTYDLSSYLIVTSQGNILINTGLASSTSVIRANIESLGFKFSDTKILLITQAHYDHTGALAEIKKLTGATLMVNEKDAGVMRDGGLSDYASRGDNMSFAPVEVDRLLNDGDEIKLDDTKLTLLHHPGHTKGSSSYLFTVKDNKRSYRVLIANMPSIVIDKKFSEVSSYPDIAKDYSYTFGKMSKLSFDIWLSSHASQFNLHHKRKPGDSYNPSAFMDINGYVDALSTLKASFGKKVKE